MLIAGEPESRTGPPGRHWPGPSPSRSVTVAVTVASAAAPVTARRYRTRLTQARPGPGRPSARRRTADDDLIQITDMYTSFSVHEGAPNPGSAAGRGRRNLDFRVSIQGAGRFAIEIVILLRGVLLWPPPLTMVFRNSGAEYLYAAILSSGIVASVSFSFGPLAPTIPRLRTLSYRSELSVRPRLCSLSMVGTLETKETRGQILLRKYLLYH